MSGSDSAMSGSDSAMSGSDSALSGSDSALSGSDSAPIGSESALSGSGSPIRRVTIIDYGLGNLHSVGKAFRHLGAEVQITCDPEAVAVAERLVLPGVGAFGDGMAALDSRVLSPAIRAAAAAGRPCLGICLGMQLLFDAGDEFGDHAGLGLLAGRVVAIAPQAGFKIPHVGWNALIPAGDRSWAGTVLADAAPGTMAYFVHSFAPRADDPDTLAVADYGGGRVTAAVQRDNVVGLQFHPEVSGPAGLAMLGRFLAM